MKTNLKSTLLFLFVLFTFSFSYSKPIDKEQAKKVAKNKLYEIDSYKKSSILSLYEIKNQQNLVSYYVFTIAPRGFIIISGDDDLPPVIYYSMENEIGNIDSKSNPLLSMLVYDMKLRLLAVSKLPKSTIEARHKKWNDLMTKASEPPVDFQEWPASGTTSTGGWIETNWTQSSPYNALCPLDGGGARSLVGCPATAMAQILNYFKTINATTFTDADDYYHNYGSNNQYWIDNDYATRGFPSFPQLNTYLSTIQQNWDNSTALTNTDKAALSFACGVAARQVFRSDGSGTYGVDQALDAYIKFNCSTSELLMGTDTSLYTRMMVNMKVARPDHLAVVDEAWSYGHNVVVDGYNTNDYYHINFGWGGTNNGWYLIPEEIPISMTVVEGVVVDIMDSPLNLPEINTNLSDNYSLYPNPAKDNLFIKTNSDLITEYAVEIYTITGQKIYTGNFNKSTISINITDLKKGIYFVNIMNGNSYTYKKFVKD